MAQLVSHLVQNILSKLGQVDPITGLFTATGGSATTFINTAFGNFENPPEEDVFKNYLAIVIRDAGGVSASPENKWSVCSAYAESTYTGTITTVTDAIASGDLIMLAKQDKFPLQQILFAINKAFENLGDLPSNKDTSLTAVVGTTEYSIPVAVKRGLKQVWLDDGDTVQQQYDWDVELTGAGTEAILRHSPAVSGTYNLIYDGVHSVISAYNDTINEYIHPEVALCASIVELLQWYNRRDENQDRESYFLALASEYEERLRIALQKHPIMREKKSPKYFVLNA